MKKLKGGPVPGTPSPMRTRLTPELQAHARRLYEETDQPVTAIALDCGVDESVIRHMGPREGWVRFVAPPRDLPPVAKLLAEVEVLERTAREDRHPEVRDPLAEPRRATAQLSPESAVHPSRLANSAVTRVCDALWLAPQDDGERVARDAHITRCIAAVMAHIDTFEETRRSGRLVPKQHLANARAISVLTEAFNKLQRLRADLSGANHNDSAHAGIDYDIPADPDAFRDELARRIDAFIASRADTADATDDPAPAVADPPA